VVTVGRGSVPEYPDNKLY